LYTSGYIETGKYELVLVATAGDLGDQVSVLQERDFKLFVEVEKNPTIFERTREALKLSGNKIIKQGEKIEEIITGRITNVTFNRSIAFLIGLGIIPTDNCCSFIQI